MCTIVVNLKEKSKILKWTLNYFIAIFLILKYILRIIKRKKNWELPLYSNQKDLMECHL
jgi:hypothetical protein